MRHIAALRRRVVWLEKKMAEHPDHHFLRFERDATEWAITWIEEDLDTTRFQELFARYNKQKAAEKGAK